MKTWLRGGLCALTLVFGPWISCAFAAPSWQEEWLARFNEERSRAGVRPFLPSPVLSQVAQEQADELARQGGLDAWPAETLAARLRGAGYSAHDWHEEILASRGAPYGSVARCPETLDGRFRDLGVGVAPSAGGTLYVFLFGWHQGDFFAAATAGLADRARVAAEMLERINRARRREGLPPAVASPLLSQVAQAHAEDMLRRSYFDHRNPEGQGPTDRARVAGYPSGVSENLVAQRFSVEEAVDAWLDSPGHRRNLLDPGCREIGLGLAVGEGYDAAPGGYEVIWVESCGRGS